jgi:hypothetical protein
MIAQGQVLGGTFQAKVSLITSMPVRELPPRYPNTLAGWFKYSARVKTRLIVNLDSIRPFDASHWNDRRDV